MDSKYWIKIKPELIKMGFNIDDTFLTNIASKNKEYIKNKILDLPFFIHELGSDMNDTNNFIVKKCNSMGDEKKKYTISSYISKGTYNQVYTAVDLSNRNEYAYRFALTAAHSDDEIVNSYIEGFIHAFFSLYQKMFLLTNKSGEEENWGDSNILKLKHIGYNVKNSFLSTITDKMDGTLYDLLSIKTLNALEKTDLFVKALIQITCLLEDLQTNFEFVHHDLKANNVFYKIIDDTRVDKYHSTNIHFFMGDFDGCRFKINDNLIFGNTNLSNGTNFNSRKDLFLLINSLYYSFNDPVWVFNVFGKFKLDGTMIGNIKKFHALYYLDESAINNLYEPKNMKDFLTSEFRARFDCWKTLGKSEDYIITVFGAKYKVYYK